jgi:hypothetical protein
VGRKKVIEEEQRSGAGGCCNEVEHGCEVKEEGQGMFVDGDGGGGAQGIDLRHVTLGLLFCVRVAE